MTLSIPVKGLKMSSQSSGRLGILCVYRGHYVKFKNCWFFMLPVQAPPPCQESYQFYIIYRILQFTLTSSSFPIVVVVVVSVPDYLWASLPYGHLAPLYWRPSWGFIMKCILGVLKYSGASTLWSTGFPLTSIQHLSHTHASHPFPKRSWRRVLPLCHVSDLLFTWRK